MHQNIYPLLFTIQQLPISKKNYLACKKKNQVMYLKSWVQTCFMG